MSDPSRSDAARPLDTATEADRDAKIEQLLLVGLDHYFAGQYDHAINVWSRALFLDRGHARARAYIERARSALAERQRQSEELLHTGIAAFHRGDSEEARRLLQAAIDAGAPPDEARALLDRLNHLDPGVPAKPPRARRVRPVLPADAFHPTAWSRRRIALAAALLALAAAGTTLAVADRNRVDWRSWLSAQDPVAAAPVVASHEAALPLPRRSEVILTRAVTLASTGRLRDALAALDTIRPTDPQRSAADRLRADIQRQLLALADGVVPVAGRGSGDTRRP